MAGVKMLDTRINPDQEKREPASKPPVYLAFGISSHIRWDPYSILLENSQEKFRKNQNNGWVAPSRWYRGFVFMPDIDSFGTAALIRSVWNDWGEDWKAPARWSCHRLQVLPRPLQGMWPRVYGGVWPDPTGPEDRGYLLWWPRSGEVPFLFVNTDRHSC